MNLGAMVALGVDQKVLEAELRKLPYEAWHLHFDPDTRGGISGIRCTVHAHDHHNKHSSPTDMGTIIVLLLKSRKRLKAVNSRTA